MTIAAKPSIQRLSPVPKVRRQVNFRQLDLANIDEFEDVQEACEVAELRRKVASAPIRTVSIETL